MELFVFLFVFVVMPIAFFVGGVIFGRKHQAKIDQTLDLSKQIQDKLK